MSMELEPTKHAWSATNRKMMDLQMFGKFSILYKIMEYFKAVFLFTWVDSLDINIYLMICKVILH